MEGREALARAAEILSAVPDDDPMKERCDTVLALVLRLTPPVPARPHPSPPA
jgi:hypothetical protein